MNTMMTDDDTRRLAGAPRLQDPVGPTVPVGAARPRTGWLLAGNQEIRLHPGRLGLGLS